MRLVLSLLLSLGLLVMLPGCGETPTEKASEDVQQLAKRLYSEIGTPEINNFQEYKFAKQIMEMRDQRITTYTYHVDRNGNRHFICKSIGYGLPYSTQLTNPKQFKSSFGDAYGKLPQREPNGLYMPDNVNATWILCSDGEGGVEPVYSEPKLFVSPVPIDSLVGR